MITQTELQELLQSTETYRVERITSSGGTQDDTQSNSQGDSHDVWIETQIMNGVDSGHWKIDSSK